MVEPATGKARFDGWLRFWAFSDLARTSATSWKRNFELLFDEGSFRMLPVS